MLVKITFLEVMGGGGVNAYRLFIYISERQWKS